MINNDYLFIPYMDSNGGDYFFFGGSICWQDLIKICESNDSLVGFNTFGWMKHSILPADKLTKCDNNSPFHGLFVSKKKLARNPYIYKQEVKEVHDTEESQRMERSGKYVKYILLKVYVVVPAASVRLVTRLRASY